MGRRFIQLFHKVTGRFRVLRFLISGGSAAGVQLSVFALLTEVLGLWYLYAATLGFVCGFIVSFVLQKYWTFEERKHQHIKTQGTRYLLLALFNLLLNNIILMVLVEQYHVLPILAQIFSSACIGFETFFISSKIFRGTIPQESSAETEETELLEKNDN